MHKWGAQQTALKAAKTCAMQQFSYTLVMIISFFLFGHSGV
jgi:hypothetical protein